MRRLDLIAGVLNILMWMQRFGRQLGALALLAMLVRALVPAGYMVAEASTPNGRYLVVQMCDGHTGVAQVIDLDTGKLVEKANTPGKTDSKKFDPPCVFAMAAPASMPPSAVQPVVFQQVAATEPAIIPDVRPGRGIAAPPPPATGPPSKL